MDWSPMGFIWKLTKSYNTYLKFLLILWLLEHSLFFIFSCFDLIFFLGAHLQEKSHNCNECGLAFKWGADLRLHVKRVHEGIKFSCKICDKEFKDPKGQKRHMLNVHGGEKIDKLE